MTVRKRRKFTRIPKARRADVSRGEFNRVVEIVNRHTSLHEDRAERIAALHRDLEIQFKRIAQLQQELDDVKRMVAKR